MLIEEKKLRKKSIGRKYYLKHRKQKCASSRWWRNKHPEQIRITTKKWRLKHKEQIRLYTQNKYEKNPEKYREYSKQWYYKNGIQGRLRNNFLKRKKYKTEYNRRYSAKELLTLRGKLKFRMRREIWSALRKNKAGRKWESLVGYSVVDLQNHLQSLFTNGMTWKNIGKWHIDHKIPQSFFIYEKPEDQEFQYCWSLDNLQPLWAKDNLEKRNKILRPPEPLSFVCHDL